MLKINAALSMYGTHLGRSMSWAKWWRKTCERTHNACEDANNFHVKKLILWESTLHSAAQATQPTDQVLREQR
jgi:hypothetical protein